VRGLPELRLVRRLSQGQLWIAVLGTLLTGIVGLNVISLSLGASSGRVARQIEGLERQNSELRARLATRVSDQRVQAGAERLGLVVPAPGEIRYLTANKRYAGIAARRLAAGDFTVSGSLAPIPTELVLETTAPAVTAPVEAPATPAPDPTGEPTTPATAPPASPAPAPAPPAPAPAPSGGGVPVG
jgi:hypothetical protein